MHVRLDVGDERKQRITRLRLQLVRESALLGVSAHSHRNSFRSLAWKRLVSQATRYQVCAVNTDGSEFPGHGARAHSCGSSSSVLLRG
jgi:hypothetical protein